MDSNVVTDAFEQIGGVAASAASQTVKLPEEILKTAKQQAIDPAQTDDQQRKEKQEAQAAKRRLPALTERDFRLAARKIAEVRQQMKEAEQQKKMVEQQKEQKKKAEMSMGQKLAAQSQSETRGGAGGIG